MTTAAQVLQIAQAQVGLDSSPSNDTPYSDWYQANFPLAGNDFRGEDWCAIFVSWVLHQAGYGLQFSWVPTGISAFRFFGVFDGTPRPGDLVFYDWNHAGLGTHVGLVEFVSWDGNVQTIEGNARDLANDPVGVHRHLVGQAGDRSFDDVVGYGHPFYKAS